MPPDADKLRQRRYLPARESPSHATVDTRLVSSIQALQSTEICIHGVIYDISKFDHPGGDQIKLFGGNDVTIQHHMIHPHHTSKHLEKMKEVGRVVDYVCKYKFDTPFERDVKEAVFAIVRRGQEFGTLGWYFRAILYVSIFFYLQYLWLFRGTSYTLAFIYAISQALMGLNVSHDANHGSCSGKHQWINNTFGFGTDLIAGNKWLWQEEHWMHHAYTNDAEKDPDTRDAEPFIVFNAYPLDHPARKWYHRFQIFYYLPVLAAFWLSSVLSEEILDLRERGSLESGLRMDNDYIKCRRKYAILMRLVYLYIHVIAPFRHLTGGIWWSWTVFGHIMVMGIVESLSLATFFELSHNFEGAERDPVAGVVETGQPVCWFKSQVETSCSYGGFISAYVTGGLSLQIEHHLFPRMNSAWFPYISPAVRKVCAKHGVRYVYYPTVWQSLVSNAKFIHAAGSGCRKSAAKDPFTGCK